MGQRSQSTVNQSWQKIQCNTETMYRSLSQDYRQALPVRLQVHLPHRYRTTHLMIHRRLQQQLEVMIFLGHALYAEENLERRYFDCRHRGAGSFGRVRNPCSKTQCKGGTDAQKEVTILHSQSQMEQQNCLEEIMESENPLEAGNNL